MIYRKVVNQKQQILLQVKQDNILVKGTVDLMDRIIDADVQVTTVEAPETAQGAQDEVQSVVSVECVAVRHNLTLRDISVPIGFNMLTNFD